MVVILDASLFTWNHDSYMIFEYKHSFHTLPEFVVFLSTLILSISLESFGFVYKVRTRRFQGESNAEQAG